MRNSFLRSLLAATVAAGILLVALWAVPQPKRLVVNPHISTNTAPPVYGYEVEAPRSGEWPRVRREYLALHPGCAVCGSKVDPQVHHVKPFHIYPDLELQPGNLITLCGPGAHNCHFSFGHCFDWQAWNPDVREDANEFAARVRQRHRGDAGR